MSLIPDPVCHGMSELPSASEERARLNQLLLSGGDVDINTLPPIARHIALGLAITTGSALGELPPTREECLAAFVTPNSVGLSAGARAWSKHAHRSGSNDDDPQLDSEAPITTTSTGERSASWWGRAKGPITTLNAGALELFERIMKSATWRNLHWLPHMVLVYEVRVEEGYGMRWSQDRSFKELSQGTGETREEWVFRGFVEPMMENGHELRWRH